MGTRHIFYSLSTIIVDGGKGRESSVLAAAVQHVSTYSQMMKPHVEIEANIFSIFSILENPRIYFEILRQILKSVIVGLFCVVACLLAEFSDIFKNV